MFKNVSLSALDDLHSRVVALESAMKINLIIAQSIDPELGRVAREAIETLATNSEKEDQCLAMALRRLLENT